jgi:hypothetical protein
MTTIGIDFSLNSPSVCICKENEMEFISFFNTDGDDWDRKEKPIKKYRRHNEIEGIVKIVPYTRGTAETIESYSDYSNEQIRKMHDAGLISELITSELARYCDKDAKVAI